MPATWGAGTCSTGKCCPMKPLDAIPSCAELAIPHQLMNNWFKLKLHDILLNYEIGFNNQMKPFFQLIEFVIRWSGTCSQDFKKKKMASGTCSSFEFLLSVGLDTLLDEAFSSCIFLKNSVWKSSQVKLSRGSNIRPSSVMKIKSCGSNLKWDTARDTRCPRKGPPCGWSLGRWTRKSSPEMAWQTNTTLPCGAGVLKSAFNMLGDWNAAGLN